jgi:hypothetical protein
VLYDSSLSAGVWIHVSVILFNNSAKLNQSREPRISAFVLSVSANISYLCCFQLEVVLHFVNRFLETDDIIHALATLEYFLLNLFIVIINERGERSSVSETFVLCRHFKLRKEHADINFVSVAKL